MIALQPSWEKTKEKIRDIVNPVSFDTWIEPLTPVRVDEDQGKLYLLLTNNMSKPILERYRSTLEKTSRESFGFSIHVVFLAPGELENEETKISQAAPSVFSDDFCLNPKYVFNTFVIGSNNRFAHAAALAVAEAPAKAYNPLFLYGGAGLGKTHLMHAIGHYIIRNAPSLKVLYVSSEMFTNELIKAIRENKTAEFRGKYRNIDVLLIDDIQFIEKKESVQEEIFHTFNTLYDANKQIILSSDRPPKEINTLEERLRSRFEWGLIADIQPPDYETRVAILCQKAEIEGIRLTDDFMDVIHLIAEKIPFNIRELEGAFIRIVAFATLTDKKVDKELAKNVLREVFATSRKELTPELIKTQVCRHFNVKMSDIDSSKRFRQLVHPRQIAMYLCCTCTDLSLPKIGECFGNRDHTTVLHARDKITADMKKDDSLREIIYKLETSLKEE